VARSSKSSSLFVLFLLGVACWSASCATSLGPGYVVEMQQVQVSFVPQAEPRIHVIAEYHLKNTGNQVLDSLDVRLPGRRFNPAELAVLWDFVFPSPGPLIPGTSSGLRMTFALVPPNNARSDFPPMPLTCLPRAGRLRFPRPGGFSVLEACRPGNGTWSCECHRAFSSTRVGSRKNILQQTSKWNSDLSKLRRT